MILASLAIVSIVRLGQRWGWRGRLLVAVFVTCALTAGLVAHAQSPPYLILRGPRTTHPPGHRAHSHVPAQREIGLSRPGYAYGWFGTQPRRQASIHHGVRNNSTTWIVD